MGEENGPVFRKVCVFDVSRAVGITRFESVSDSQPHRTIQSTKVRGLYMSEFSRINRIWSDSRCTPHLGDSVESLESLTSLESLEIGLLEETPLPKTPFSGPNFQKKGQVWVSNSLAPNLVVKFDGEICGGVLVENASDGFPQQRKLENLLPNFAGSSPPISPKTSPTSLWKSLALTFLAGNLMH